MKWTSFLVAAVFAAITFGLWAWLNRPTTEPPWPGRVQGMAFSPFRTAQDPVQQLLPTAQQIEADLQLLSGKVTAISSAGQKVKRATHPATASTGASSSARQP